MARLTWSRLLPATPGFSGADLANLLNEVSSPTAFNFSFWYAIPEVFYPVQCTCWHCDRLLHTNSDVSTWLSLQAAILTGRRSKSALTLKEIDDSVDRIVAGMEGTPMVDGKSKSLVAYHEVGHAICSTLTPGMHTTSPPVIYVPTTPATWVTMSTQAVFVLSFHCNATD